MQDSHYSIPVPAWFSSPPLVKLPWSLLSIPRLSAHKERAVEALTEKVKQQYGVNHCIPTDCARSAYAMYVRAMELKGEVIIQSMMHTPTAVLLSNHGLSLVFSDVEPDFCMSAEILEPLISRDTCAIMVTHMFGRAAPLDRIASLVEGNSIRLMSNMVHMPPGVRIQGKPLTSFADVSYLSFNMDKPLHGIWGGALLTNSDEVYERVRALSLAQLKTPKVWKLLFQYLMMYRYKPLLGPLQYLYYTLRGTYGRHDDVENTFNSFPADNYVKLKPKAIHPLQAAFAEKLLDQSDEMVARRAERARQAIALFAETPGVTTPAEDDYPNSFLYFPILLDESISRYDLGVALARKGIEAKWRYYPLHLERKFADCRTGDLANTMRMWRQYLLLPVLCGSIRDVEYVVRTTRECISQVTKGSGG